MHRRPYRTNRLEEDRPLRLLAAHPVPDRYGADLMFLAALRSLRASGDEVTVAVPEDGPLVADLRAVGAEVLTTPFPVLRKALLRPAGLARLTVDAPRSLRRLVRLIADVDPDVVYVNTLTLPVWIAAARLARRPVVCHVREAEDRSSSVIRRALAAPLLGCHRIVTNSQHTARHLTGSIPRLAGRIEVVHNGFSFGDTPEGRAPRSDGELLLVGRLSPRKGQDVAIEALSLLHQRGHPMRLRLVGTEFRGYEWYVDDLRRAATALGLAEHVIFDGYRGDIPECNAAADVVIVPSRIEPFGNVAVEALAANRPLVVSATGGLREIVDDGETGLLVRSDDAVALADAVERLVTDPEAAQRMASAGAQRARERFSLDRYEREIARVLHDTAGVAADAPGRSGR